ncbi:MAG: cation transporter [Candidatus Omnitrophica bacterium]|nr:cation transporter [Candidatus Omnitrophota bacterium]
MRNGRVYENTEKYREVFISGVIVNLALAMLKLSMGLFGYSKLILMDGMFAFSNAVMLFLMWQGDILEKRPPDDKHPYGYGKVLFLIAAVGGLIVLVISIYMFFYSLNSMDWLEIHRSHSGAMMAAIISIIANEALYRYLMDEGERHSNGTLLWNAYNNRLNVVVSVIVLVCLTFASLGAFYLERAGVGIISVIMFFLSLRILLAGFSGIMDKIPPKKMLNKIKYSVKKSDGVKEVLDIKARYIGSSMYMDIYISVDDDLSMNEADKISRAVELKVLKEIKEVQEVNVVIS